MFVNTVALDLLIGILRDSLNKFIHELCLEMLVLIFRKEYQIVSMLWDGY
jgi:hypothetical protein